MKRQLLALVIALALWAPTLSRAQEPEHHRIGLPEGVSHVLAFLPYLVAQPWTTCLVGYVEGETAMIERLRPPTDAGCGVDTIGVAHSWAHFGDDGRCAETEAERADLVASKEAVRLLVCPNGNIHIMSQSGSADLIPGNTHPT